MLHRGEPFPDCHVRTVLKGIRRIKGDVVNRKLPITLEILRAIHKAVDLSQPSGATFWAVCLTSFFGMLRKSSLFPPSGYGVPLIRHVKVCNECLVVSFSYSKTVQCKQRQPFVVLPMYQDHPELCPVRALVHAWLLAGITSLSQPLLPITNSCGTIKAMTGFQYQRLFKSVMAKLSLHGYSTHSFRRGGATHALYRGVPAEIIMAQGDWKSLSYLDYLHVNVVRSRSTEIKKMFL